MVTLNSPPDGYHRFANKASDGLQSVNQIFTITVRPRPRPQNAEPAYISTWFGSDAKEAFEKGFGPYFNESLDVSSCDLKWFSNQELQLFDRFTRNGMKKIGAAGKNWLRAKHRI